MMVTIIGGLFSSHPVREGFIGCQMESVPEFTVDLLVATAAL